ncbi:MAG: NUDIX domain-containing protein [Puniceicoccales bacterium]|jgi:8-oxo-dGTP pyrophosphatase MutT (NUDIX family)|nr:NUDIX domain-containing protein [Puniceicoccales bacterium]
MEARRNGSTNIKVVALLFLVIFCSGTAWCAREEKINRVEVFVSAYCYRINRVRGPEILILKRASTRELAPSMWECGGGSVHENENFEDAARRQLLEEAGITATRWKVLECFEVEVRPGVIVPGIAFTCKANADSPVKIDPREHTEYRWATIKELDDMALVTQKMHQSIVKLLMIQDKLL